MSRPPKKIPKAIPTVTENHSFVTPIKVIKSINDMDKWDKSEAYAEIMGFIIAINDSLEGVSNAKGSAGASEGIVRLAAMMDTLENWIDEIPPIDQPQRFGNAAYKTWFARLKEGCIDLLQQALPHNLYRAIPEIGVYLEESFGNSTRIDYGTGHELAFVMFLCSLFKIGFLKETDFKSTACQVFVRYLDVVRKLQKTYRMEPAGSHGVWSLDDYQFVPFIWGSSQLIGTGIIEPGSFYKPELVNRHWKDYMFMGCIKYINEVKTGLFAEHSCQLWNISGVNSWSKINSGLIKMYRGEVLSKFPLVQHIVFGSLFTLNTAPVGSSVRKPPTVEQWSKEDEEEFKKPGDAVKGPQIPSPLSSEILDEDSVESK